MELIRRLACRKTIVLLTLCSLLGCMNVVAAEDKKTQMGPADTTPFPLSAENLYRWPDQGYKIRDSKMQTVTLKYGKTQTSSVVTKFQYWTREKFNTKTNLTYYELHGKCIFENIDVSSYTTADALECRIGLQRDAGRDWAMIKIPFKAGSASVDDQVKDWSCTDSH